MVGLRGLLYLVAWRLFRGGRATESHRSPERKVGLETSTWADYHKRLMTSSLVLTTAYLPLLLFFSSAGAGDTDKDPQSQQCQAWRVAVAACALRKWRGLAFAREPEISSSSTDGFRAEREAFISPREQEYQQKALDWRVSGVLSMD